MADPRVSGLSHGFWYSPENGFAEGGVRNSRSNSCDRQAVLLSNEAFAPPPQQLILDIKQMLQATQEARRSQPPTIEKDDRQKGNKSPKGADTIEQWQAWATADDPILRAEALRQLAKLQKLD